MHRPLSARLFGLLLLLALLVASPAPGAGVDPVAKQYGLARLRHANLLADQTRVAERAGWLAARDTFLAIYRRHGRHELAANGLFMAGTLAHETFQRFGNPLDLGEAIICFKDLATLFPDHRLADDALYTLATIYEKDKAMPELAARTYAMLVKAYPAGDMVGPAGERLRRLEGGKTAGSKGALRVYAGTAKKRRAGGPAPDPARVRPVRAWSAGDYTRVVIETSAPVRYQEIVTPNLDPAGQLTIKLYASRLPPEQQCLLAVGDGLLRQVRCEQDDDDTVRLVLATERAVDYKIFNLTDPFRVVVDLTGRAPDPGPAKLFEGAPPSLAQQLGLGIRRVVLDPGHGGRHPGAVGLHGIMEKEVTLAVARKIVPYLRGKGFEVLLTREDDTFLPLEERTAIANTRAGDLFVSIHVNASPKAGVRGVETYFLDLARDEDAMRIAALENATSTHQLSDLQDLLLDLMRNSKLNESAKLAEAVQSSLVAGLGRQYAQVVDLGVKRAPFVVLIGARMPAILTEIAFLSNPQEAGRLRDGAYLDAVAQAIAEGVSSYAGELAVARH